MPNENERDSSIVPANDNGGNNNKRSRYRNMMLAQQIQHLPAQYQSLDAMLKLVDEVGASEYAGILHDKDPDVEPHIHIFMHFEHPRDIKAIAKKLHIEPQYIQRWDNSTDNGNMYLIHRTNKAKEEGKYQYDPSEVKANFDYLERIKIIEAKKSKARANRDSTNTDVKFLLDCLYIGAIPREEVEARLSGSQYGRYRRQIDDIWHKHLQDNANKWREGMKREGIEILGEYIDRAKSASKDIQKREDFQRMIEDSEKGLFGKVLVYKLDRFARSREDSAIYKSRLKRKGVKVVSATEPLGDGPESILLESMLEGYAEYYSRELSQKIHRGQKENAMKGLNNGGNIPLGYQLGPEKKLIIDPITAPIVREAFQRYAAGDSIKEIFTDFNERGLRTTKGNVFTHSTFSVLLRNRKYIGEYKYQDIVIPNGVPAIVSDELFQQVQERLSKNRQKPAAAKASEKYLLTTKLYCGECGKLMAGESGTGYKGVIYRYYKCHNAKHGNCNKRAVRKEWIEDLVVRETMKVVMDGPLMEQITDRLLEMQGEESFDLKHLKQELKDVKRKIKNMVNAIQEGIITASTQKALVDLEEQEKEIEQQIAIESLENPVLSREQIVFFLERYKKTDINDEVQRQRLIDSFVNSVFVRV